MTAAAATMDGPAGVSKWKDSKSPNSVEQAPKAAAQRAIASGERAKLRAAAAGVINIAAIKSAPTILSAKATVSAKAKVRIRR